MCMCYYVGGGDTMKRAKFTLSIDDELLKRIKKQAIDEGRPVSEVMEMLIENYLELAAL